LNHRVLLRVWLALFASTLLTWVFGIPVVTMKARWAWYPFVIFNGIQGICVYAVILYTCDIRKLFLRIFSRNRGDGARQGYVQPPSVTSDRSTPPLPPSPSLRLRRSSCGTPCLQKEGEVTPTRPLTRQRPENIPMRCLRRGISDPQMSRPQEPQSPVFPSSLPESPIGPHAASLYARAVSLLGPESDCKAQPQPRPPFHAREVCLLEEPTSHIRIGPEPAAYCLLDRVHVPGVDMNGPSTPVPPIVSPPSAIMPPSSEPLVLPLSPEPAMPPTSEPPILPLSPAPPSSEVSLILPLSPPDLEPPPTSPIQLIGPGLEMKSSGAPGLEPQ
jgi:hypothetical protein